MHNTKIYIFHILAVVVVSIWGTTFISTKLLLAAGLTPIMIFISRFVIAYIGIVPFSRKRLFCKSLIDEIMVALLGLSGGSLYFLTENMALEISQASSVALIVCTTPVITIFLMRIFYPEERISGLTIIGSIVALAGVALITYNGSSNLQLNPAGDLLALSSATLWSIYSVIIRYLGTRYDTLFITRKTFFYGLLTALPIMLVGGEELDWSPLTSATVIGNLLFLGVVASLLCYAAWSLVLKRIGTAQASNYMYINPVVATLLSAFILGEKITPMAIVGAAMILGSVYLAVGFHRR